MRDNNKPDRLDKGAALRHWHGLPDTQPISPDPIPYKHQGSTYDEDGIRITGSRQFIDSVLSRIKDVLKFENTVTRLGISYQESTDKTSRRPTGKWSCYVQVHVRGREATMAGAIFGGTYDEALGRARGESNRIAEEVLA